MLKIIFFHSNTLRLIPHGNIFTLDIHYSIKLKIIICYKGVERDPQTSSNYSVIILFFNLIYLFAYSFQGLVWTQSPTTINYAAEVPTFGEITGVTSGEQWMSEFHPEETTFMIMASPLPGRHLFYNLKAVVQINST